jgi:hypothetical protein
LDVIAGREEQLVGKIQERYGIAREAAQEQVKEFTKTVQFDSVPDETDSTATAERARARGISGR